MLILLPLLKCLLHDLGTYHFVFLVCLEHQLRHYRYSQGSIILDSFNPLGNFHLSIGLIDNETHKPRAD